MTFDTTAHKFAWTPSVSQLGTFPLSVTVTDGKGGSVTQSWSLVISDTNHAPVITSTAPTTGKEAVAYIYTVTATDADGDALHFVAGTLQSGMTFDTTAHKFAWTPTFTQAGTYPVSVTVTDGKGGSVTQSWNLVIADSNRAPVVTSTAPTTGKEAVAYVYTVTATDADGDVLHFKAGTLQTGMTFDTTAHKFAWNPTFTQAGTYPVSVTVTDGKGGNVTQSWNLVIADSNRAPVVTSTATTSGIANVGYSYQAAATDADGDPTVWSLVSGPTGLSITSSGLVTWNPTASGSYSAQIQVSDGRGGSGMQTWSIQVAVPPPPVDTIPAAPVAPPLPAGGVPPFVSQVSFLWSGSQPTIFGVIKDSLDTARLAVLRGRVIGVDNAPIPGVRVQVIGHPEFGHTFTRADGRYELVANGGVSVWADFGKSGYLPLQRLSKPFWKQYSGVLDVVLTKLDLISTVVTSGSPQTQVAVSTPRTDAVGTRMLSVDIPAGTHARFQMPDGSTQPATQLTLRTTEYTVGPTGPLAMPSDLPTTSIYTYAFEVTADEELAAGAVHILFDHPVVTHLENFRHFPVGDIVPYGVLNRTTHRWETFPSGRVVAVLSIANGHAVLDVNGNGLPASPDTLAALGIDTAELRVIANRFTIGKTLWRVQSTRFSAGDFNWSAPPGAAAPNVDTSNGPLHKPSPCDPSRNGCVLDLEQQRLGEDFPVPGTGLSLHYRSDRSPNHIQDYRVRFRLTVPVRNQAFRGGKARLWVAGQEIDDTINGSDSIQVITLQWNGLDAWGRQLNGSVQGQLDVSYNWAEIPRPTAGFGGPCSGGCVETSSEIPEIIHPLSTVMTVPLGRLHTPGLGVQGWSIDGVQSLDRAAGYLVGGDGTDRDVLAMGTGVGNLGIDTVTYFTEARTGRQLFVHAYNIVPTFQADGAGNLYFSANTVNWMDVRGNTFGTSMLLRRRLSGVIDVLIGSTNGVAIAENAPADSIALTLPPRIFHVSRDGVIYFLDYSGDGVNRIWRRDLDGHLHRVFGGGDTLASSRSALGMKGTDLSLSDNGMINQWNVSSLAEDGDGSLHVIANQTFYNNWRFILSPAGTLESSHESSVGWLGYQNLVGHNAKDQALYIGVNGCTDVIAVYNGGGCNTLGTYDGDTANFTWEAGSLQGVQGYGGVNPSPPSFADGAPSSSGYFGPVGSIRALAAAPDGTTYILAPQSLVSAGPDSAIHQIAGVFMTNGGMSTNPRLLDLRNVFSMTVLPNGRIVLADHDPYLGTIFRTIDPTAALMSQVPSGDGKLLYVFDNWARHTFTLDALTGDTIRRMTYDSSGRVTQIMDAYGNQTTLSYSASTIDIQAPGGQHTVLNLSGGQVVSVTGPDTHSDLLSWQSGFLASHTDPMGRTSRYGFDTLGNLSYDQRPDGKRVTLSSTFDLAAQKRVAKMTQPSGRTLQATTTFLPDKGSRTVIVGEEGDTSVIRRWATGDMETTSPDHTVTHVTALEHPQFTSLVPLPGLTTVTTPNGIVSQTTMTVGVTQGSVPAYGPVRTWNDTTVTPSGTWLRAWDSLSRTWTLTDPQGRVSKIFVGRFGAVDSQRVPGLPTVSYTRDSRGRTTTVRQGGRVWRTVWGAANTVDSMVDPLGRAISLRWDASMRSLGGTTPDGRTLSLTRWADGSLASLTPSGRKAHQFFTNSLGDDSLYLPPVVDSTGGGSLLWNWTQDRTLSGMGTPVGSFSVGRDSLGRVVTVIQPSDTVRIAYDLQGRVDSLRRAGQKLAWTWDGTLPLSETWTGAVTGAVSTTWDANFRPTSQTAAGNTIAYSYDPDGTLTHAGQLLLARDPVSGFASGDTVGSIVHRLGHNGRGEILADTVRNGSVILSLATFTRDSLGRILTKADSLNGSRTNWRYHYDLAGQLDSVWANGSLNAWYGYDSNGVRLRGTGISGVTVDAQDREIAANGVAFGYDENGQMVSRSNLSGTTRYHYTLQGELLSVKLATGDSISYTLDPAGRRIARSLNGVVTNRWLWDGQLRLVAEIDLTGNLTTRYVYGTQINVPDYMIRNGTTYRLVADQLGSVRLVLNVTTGAVVSSFNYDVWGNITSTINPSFQPFGFAGGLRDDATGLTHFSARDYDPTIRRWTGKDQIGFNGGLSNIYGYVGNDPVNLRDPNGNQVAECAILVGTALTVISVSNMYHFGKSRGLGPNFHGTEISSTTSADSALKHLMLDATKQAGASVTAQEATNLLEPNPKANLLNILNTLLSHLNPEQEKGKKK
jgi:RHS repeat-associated protein